MSENGPYYTTRVNQITVDADQTLTVYLGALRAENDIRSQIEIRVTHDGVREVFVDPTDTSVRLVGYKDWTEYGVAHMQEMWRRKEEDLRARLLAEQSARGDDVVRLAGKVDALRRELETIKSLAREALLEKEDEVLDLLAERVGLDPEWWGQTAADPARSSREKVGKWFQNRASDGERQDEA